MVHCSDVGNRLSEFCSAKVHIKAETGKSIPRKSRFVIVGRNIFESHFLVHPTNRVILSDEPIVLRQSYEKGLI